MTGYTVHTGSNEKFIQGWDQIFKKGAAKKSGKAKAKTGKASAKKTTVKNATAKKKK